LMTAHSSKGLEFKYIFFAGCNAGVWEKKRKPGRGYKLPDNIFSTLSAGDNDLEELRRLFYVALTRAEENLYISYSRFNKDGKEIEPSVFIAEIQAGQNLQPVSVQIDQDTATNFALLQFQKPQSPEIEKIEEEYINRVLEKFVMNVTALNNYLKCPLDFYFKNLVRIPSPKNEATEFGSAVHYALEQLFKKMGEHPQKQFPDKEVFIKDFEWYMLRHRESFTRQQYDRRMEQGNDILSDYYDKYLHQWNKIVSVERNIRNVVVQGIPLKGKLDKLEFDGNAVNVVDYKTGDFEKAKKDKKQFDAPNEKMPNGGDYWRQGVFYKILVDNYENKQWHVLTTEFDFVEPDKKKNYYKEKLLITNADITTVQEQIKNVWQKIQQRNFYTGCGKDDCHWCNFVKTNNLAIALHDVEEDAEEN
ncbi:MAG: PD-(D/E)XK nuclease family protein, partial [Dokdonella sp.]|uniref:PD-(D/E)XK nuclease family protein n=1 Tax=Dokdonella sp. TaxID=2291710 RepID=UPI003BB16531